MRILFFSALCALSLSIHAKEAPKDTVDSYVIDNIAIEKFDGSQLENKTISKYVIVYKDLRNVVEKRHVITTKTTKTVYIDGQKVDESKMNKLSSDKIAHMTVINKDGQKVIYIETKQVKKQK